MTITSLLSTSHTASSTSHTTLSSVGSSSLTPSVSSASLSSQQRIPTKSKETHEGEETFLITGANSGVGFEVAKQLTTLAFDKNSDSTTTRNRTIILACRNREKALDAKRKLEEHFYELLVQQKQRRQKHRKDLDDRVSLTVQVQFEILLLDMCDLESIDRAMSNTSLTSRTIDYVILNAGGFAGKGSLDSLPDKNNSGQRGPTKIFSLNVLGGAYLTHLLIERGLVKDGATILYVSSETSRGIKGLNTQHTFVDGGSIEEMKSICNGSYFRSNSHSSNRRRSPPPPTGDTDVYGRVKLIGNFWVGSMARKFPQYRFVAVSPGNTAGTNVVNHMRMPPIAKLVANAVVQSAMVAAGRFHPVEVGAKRYIDVMFDDGSRYERGHFYGTKLDHPNTGPMCDQVVHFDGLYCHKYQENAYEAIRSFFPVDKR